MIRVLDSSGLVEYCKCSKCGEIAYDDDDEYCQLCGHSFSSVQNITKVEDTNSEVETICIVYHCCVRTRLFIVAQLQVDTTPAHLRNNPMFQRRMMGVSMDDLYVFKTDEYPYLREGQQINLNLKHYDNFRTTKGYKILYDSRHFSKPELSELYHFG